MENAAATGFKMTVTGASALVAVALSGVGVFLIVSSAPAFTAHADQLPLAAPTLWALAGPLVFGSIWSSTLALAIALPLGVGVGLYITWYAPRRLAGLLAAMIDTLAAIPSVVYGLWGLMCLAPVMSGVYDWAARWLGWFPLFAGTASSTGRTIGTGALVLAIMILPIIAALCREVFQRAPAAGVEAALGLGATRWEMIRLAVLPWAGSGIVSAGLLGLGRALGETMAIAMVVSPAPFFVGWSVITSANPNTVAAFIAQFFPEAHQVEVAALIGLGLIMFGITLLVNAVGRRLADGRQGQR
jgi:phosphate transport system permease protein